MNVIFSNQTAATAAFPLISSVRLLLCLLDSWRNVPPACHTWVQGYWLAADSSDRISAASCFFFSPQLQTSPAPQPPLLRAPASAQHLAVFMFLLLFLAPCCLGLWQPLGNSMKPTERGEELVVSTDSSCCSVQTHLTSRKPAHRHHSRWIMAESQAAVIYWLIDFILFDFVFWSGRGQVKQIGILAACSTCAPWVFLHK